MTDTYQCMGTTKLGRRCQKIGVDRGDRWYGCARHPSPENSHKLGFDIGDVVQYVHPTSGELCKGIILGWDHFRRKFRIFWLNQKRILWTKPSQLSKARYTRIARGFELVPIETKPRFKIVAFDPTILTSHKPGVHELPGTTMEFLQAVAEDGRFSVDMSTDPPTICFQNMLDGE